MLTAIGIATWLLVTTTTANVSSAAAFAALGLAHAYQLKGNVVDFLFVFAQPAQGALAAHTFGSTQSFLQEFFPDQLDEVRAGATALVARNRA